MATVAAAIAVGLGIGILGWSHTSSSLNEELHAAKAAQAWGELPTRTILRSAEPDLKSYFLKEQEYLHTIRDIDTLQEPSALPSALHRLRTSPFFNEAYRLEYNVPWEAVGVREGDGVRCDRLRELYPQSAGRIPQTYLSCKREGGTVSTAEALEALRRGLRR